MESRFSKSAPQEARRDQRKTNTMAHQIKKKKKKKKLFIEKMIIK